jgi:hypothetical protein
MIETLDTNLFHVDNPPLKLREAGKHAAEDKRFFLSEHLLNVGLGWLCGFPYGAWALSVPSEPFRLSRRQSAYVYVAERLPRALLEDTPGRVVRSVVGFGALVADPLDIRDF